jgi:excinuclease ABC subunit C
MFDHKTFLANVTSEPGVYQMLNDKKRVIYVGKAKNLKKRLSSYFLKKHDSSKTALMVKQIADISVIVTHTENEALILENNLIKKHKPRYNILFRDDKSYPYIYLTTHETYPKLDFYRGSRKVPGKLFGPYPSVLAVRNTINLLQKVFKLRQCKNSFFNHRTRPCLQYQINRCTAPCVGKISPEDYQETVKHAVMLLDGKADEICKLLDQQMEAASEAEQYELAAQYRDQITDLREIQASQHVAGRLGDIDVVALALQGEVACVQLLQFRGGQLLGQQSFFPKLPEGSERSEVLPAFITQHYLGRRQQAPKEIILSEKITNIALLSRLLSNEFNQNIKLSTQVRSERAQLLKLALTNVDNSLETHLKSKASVLEQLSAVQQAFDLPQMPSRIECFDVSHTQGEATVASCVVFGLQGDDRQAYRRFNIRDVKKGDDYAAMHQAVFRHYKQLKMAEKALPDILLIDGGPAQLDKALEALEELQVNSMTVIAIAKGKSRKPGFETFFMASKKEGMYLPADAMALHLLQHVRDEAHRFAITGHRKQRAKARQHSPLENVPGIGAKRRQVLLKYFGGWQGLARASVEDVAKVHGVSKLLAKQIHDALHDD